MKEKLNLFIKNLIIFTLIAGIAEWAFSYFVEVKWFSKSWPFVVLFFMAFTLLMHRYLLVSTEGNPKRFVFSFMLITTVKILLYLAIMLIYVLFNRPDAIGFIVAFFINYFLFTAFELNTVIKLFPTSKS
jgi:hypothetical protein